MGWTYMVICIFDFLVSPILWSVYQGVYHGDVTSQWYPLTLHGAGLFHIAMGAILGIEAFNKNVLSTNQRYSHDQHHHYERVIEQHEPDLYPEEDVRRND